MSFHEECGVFGVYNNTAAAELTALGLHSLQHRGQEAAGIISYDGTEFHVEKTAGLVGDHFSKKSVIENLSGCAAIGHNRYSTSGEAGSFNNIQPMFAEFDRGGFAIAHNGNLTNQKRLRRELIDSGALFYSTSDTEIFIHLMARSKEKTVVERFRDALLQADGAFSIVAITTKKMIGARDPNGFRPLVLGYKNGAYFLSSETCAFDITEAEFVREIEPGEIVVITEEGVESIKYADRPRHFCIFEFVYFSRPDSVIENKSVHYVRKDIGRTLARQTQLNVDLVVPVPDSGIPAAMGYSEASGIPYDLGITRNHYVGRTFIEPEDRIRNLGVKMKHNANSRVLKGKRIALIDDSIVRGTTSRKLVELVRKAGAKEIHLLIASPPIVNSCYYGVDTPNKEDLVANRMSIEEMRVNMGADSLSFLSLEGMHNAVNMTGTCDACFTNNYPVEVEDEKGRK